MPANVRRYTMDGIGLVSRDERDKRIGKKESCLRGWTRRQGLSNARFCCIIVWIKCGVVAVMSWGFKLNGQLPNRVRCRAGRPERAFLCRQCNGPSVASILVFPVPLAACLPVQWRLVWNTGGQSASGTRISGPDTALPAFVSESVSRMGISATHRTRPDTFRTRLRTRESLFLGYQGVRTSGHFRRTSCNSMTLRCLTSKIALWDTPLCPDTLSTVSVHSAWYLPLVSMQGNLVRALCANAMSRISSAS